MNPPCYRCEARTPGCHAECEKYRAWKAQLPKLRSDGEADAFLTEQSRARHRRWNRRNGK